MFQIELALFAKIHQHLCSTVASFFQISKPLVMNYLNNPIEAPQSSAGSIFVQWAIGITLLVAGFRIGYCTDTDWDKDGIPNDIESKCNLNPHSTDSDGDGTTDNKDPYPHGSGVPENFVVCLTLENREKICFHPTNILLIDKVKNENIYEVLYWKDGGKVTNVQEHQTGVVAVNVQENLTQIEENMYQIGYPHFYRVNRQDLPNMLLADCLSADTLYVSQDENIWCHVSKEKLSTVKKLVDYRDCNRTQVKR